jgi:putative hemolysin
MKTGRYSRFGSAHTTATTMRRVLLVLFLLEAASSTVARGLANPASAFCIKSGGKLEIRTSPGGQYGVCRLPDGREIEEWSYYRANRGKRR